MRLAGRLLGAALVCIAVAGCDPLSSSGKGDGGPASRDIADDFYHAIDVEQSGYYLPVEAVSVEGWTFHHLFMGQKADFGAWEKGPRSRVFAPLMIEFDDAASPMVQTETGESRSGRDRVLPTRYRVTARRVVFEGRSERLGEIRFEGDLDQGRLAESKRNLGDEAAVLTGTLTVGDHPYPVRLRWWAGD